MSTVRRTRIVQTTANSCEGAPQMLTQSNSDEQPILVMVKRRYGCCCCDCKLDIPAGLTVLEENCGKSTGIMRPGAHWCYCCNKRVACMMTKAIVNYNAPVANCPTKDNAYISVDLYFTFRMPTDETQVKNFVYRLGAARFDELLAAEIDEDIRSFINGIWLSQVFDLKGEMAKKMLGELNQKFALFGIFFETCNITKVHVSQQLSQALEEKTKIRYTLANHIKDYENKKLSVENEQNQLLADMNRENDKKLSQLKAQIQRAKVEKEQMEINATTQLEVAIVKAEQEGNVLITKVQGEKNIIESQVKASVVEQVNQARSISQARNKNVDQEADVMGIDAKAQYEAAQAKMYARLEEGKSELKNVEAFDAQRRHDYELNRAKIFEDLARKQQNLVVSGKAGESLLTALLDFGDGKKQ